MIGPSEYSAYYSLSELQAIADLVQFTFLATVAGVTEEVSVYDPLLLDFLGRAATLKFIPAAVDYWGDQLLQQTTTGTNETENFPDRQPALLKLAAQLTKELADDFLNLAETYHMSMPSMSRFIPSVSYGDNGRGVLLTPDPQEWPKQTRTRRGTELPWEV
jgi:hypothetical protein